MSSLRSGYTTGACAAAAAKAATLALLRGRPPAEVALLLPAGVRATFAVAGCEPDGDGFRCTVIKDGGDDPDATHGAEICATVRRAQADGIVLAGGVGVGMVTKPGLELPVGSPAINPVPRKMIEAAVREVTSSEGAGGGFQVTISVPRGEEIAQRTLNARLGILGGISILGTTGIVEPFSHAAYTASIAQALDVAQAAGCREVVLTTGRRTERFAMRHRHLPEEAFVEMGDYLGFALQACRERGFRAVTLAAMIGKMAKIAAGHTHTHADVSSLDLRVVINAAGRAGAGAVLLDRLAGAHTARESGEILQAHGLGQAFSGLCTEARHCCQEHLDPAVRVGVLLFGFDGELLGKAGADA